MAKVFISYSSKNRDLVKALAADIDELGHNVWFDKELTGGHAWWDSILQAVRACEVFIFALSPESLDSEPCSREYKYAYALNKIILPVLITGTVSPNLLPRELSLLQYVDYRQADKAATLKLGRAFTALPTPKPLPQFLPLPPDVPVAPILGLREKIDSPNGLSFEQQTALLFQLKEELKSPATRADVLELLRRFRGRRDILALVQGQIDEIIQGSQAPTAKPFVEAPKLTSQRQEPPPSPKPQAPVNQAPVQNNLWKNLSLWMPNRLLLVGSILIWAVWFVSVSTYDIFQGILISSPAYYLMVFTLPWILQSSLTALLVPKKKELRWYFLGIVLGPFYEVFESSSLAENLSFQNRLMWSALISGLSLGLIIGADTVVMAWFANNVFGVGAITPSIYFGVWGAVLGLVIGYLLSVFKNLANRNRLATA
jgi:hypothetical protein